MKCRQKGDLTVGTSILIGYNENERLLIYDP